jgi:hypothetical protein
MRRREALVSITVVISFTTVVRSGEPPYFSYRFGIGSAIGHLNGYV